MPKSSGNYKRAIQRRINHLKARITEADARGENFRFDKAEYAALCWALRHLKDAPETVETWAYPCGCQDLTIPCAQHADQVFSRAAPVLNIKNRRGTVITFPVTSTRCQSGQDGECFWFRCPQLRDKEPATSGRDCPLEWPER